MSVEVKQQPSEGIQQRAPSDKARNLMVRLHRQLLKEGFSTWGFIIKVTAIDEATSDIYLDNFSVPPADFDKFKQNTMDALESMQDPRMAPDANRVLDQRPRILRPN